MEYLWIVILAPLIVPVGLAIAYWLGHPRSLCKSTAELFHSALRDNRGEDLVEYALIALFVAIVAGAVIPGTVESVRNIFNKVVAALGGTPAPAMAFTEPSVARIICVVLAVVLLGVIFLRRHKNPKY